MKGIVLFLAGAALGSLSTWLVLKGRYEAYVAEEIQSVKEEYGRTAPREKEPSMADTPEAEPEEKEEVKKELNTMVEELKYTDGNDEEGGRTGHPYVITPDQFAAENEFYDKITLTLYASGEVEDDDGITLYTPNEVDNMAGLKNLDSMGEYEVGVVYVRNDILKTDYEIVADESNYLEVRSNL